jgi:diguanylate cyclase (GGDEF)-like protein
VDLTVYDRRALRLRWVLAFGLLSTSAFWYFADFHPELIGIPNAGWFAPAVMLVFMAGLGGYANGLIRELRLHATEHHEKSEETRLFARVDPLTQVLNRATFLEELGTKIRRSKTHAPVALFVVDLDRFKAMNDIFGHAFGDAVLKRVGHVLAREVGVENAGRLGGDEFAFMLTGSISRSICETIGNRVLQALGESVSLLGRNVQVEASIGVAWSPEHDIDRLDLMGCADLALYIAKQAGRSRVACFDAGLMKEECYRRSIERELRGAILMNELDVYYQPLHALADGRISGLEALVRWRHPVRGLISPAEFVPIAERSSLIEQLGDWVFARVCADAARWPDLKVSINVSPVQLKARGFLDMVHRCLAGSGCDPKNIAIEITERVLMDEIDGQVEQLHQLRALGISIWLDDFGSGHSGLSYLRDFPIDVIKIDKGLVQDMGSNSANHVFVSAIAQLGRGLDREVVAEGIESEDDLTMVRAAGCSHAQGYHFARPMQAKDVAAYAGFAVRERAA